MSRHPLLTLGLVGGLVALPSCSDSTAPHLHPTRVLLAVRTQLLASTGEPVRPLAFDISIRADGDTSWTPASRYSWDARPPGPITVLQDSLGPDFHGTLRLIPDLGPCPAFATDTLQAHYDQPLGRQGDTLLVTGTISARPTARLVPGELCASATGPGVQAWFIIDSIGALGDSLFGRFTLGYSSSSANYDGHLTGHVQGSQLLLTLVGDDPGYCPAGALLQLPLRADSSLGLTSTTISPAAPCYAYIPDSLFFFVPNPGLPWF